MPVLKARSDFEAYVTASASAVFGDFAAFPIDTLKVRMQRSATALIPTARALLDGGTRVVFKGVSASSFRQATYGGMRLSLYEPVRNAIASVSASDNSLQVKLLAGAVSGAVSSAIMCPADVVKIRMQAGEAQYTGVAHALQSIVRHEGVGQLWRGVAPTSLRASVVAAVELGLYESTKDWLVETHGFARSSSTFLVASVVATVGSIAVSFPIDVSKTIMISQGVTGVGCTLSSPTATRAAIHPSMFHCIAHTARKRGLLGLYTGSLPSLGRQLVCNTGMFLCYEELKQLFWVEDEPRLGLGA